MCDALGQNDASVSQMSCCVTFLLRKSRFLAFVHVYLGLYTSNTYPKLHSSLPVFHKFNNINFYCCFK